MNGILIVDDESIVAMHLEELLCKLGYTVAGKAYSATEAVAKAGALHPDLVLMDIVMPDGGSDGIDAAEEIRRIHDVPVVFLTAYSDDEFIQRAKSAQPYGYIVKPFQDRELRAVIELTMAKRQLERKLQASEHRLHALVDHLPCAVSMKDTQGRYELVNRTFETWFRISRARILGRTADELFPEHLAEQFTGEDRRVLELGETVWFEETAHLDGEERVFYGVKFPLPDESGAPCAICSVQTDFTENKRTQAALCQSEEKYRSLFENSPDSITIIGRDGTILESNIPGLQPNGAAPGEYEGMHFTDLLPAARISGDDLQRYLEIFQDVLRGNPAPCIEVETVDGKGEFAWYDVSAAPLKKDGEVVAVQTRARNITAQKRLEQHNTAMREQLLQLQKLDALGTLAGGLAHELNNMLAVILGNANLALLDLRQGQTWHEEFKEIESASLRARELISQLLTFARHAKPAMEPLAVSDAVDDALKALRGMPAPGLTVKSDLQFRCRVLADRAQLFQALLNIGVNALEAMPGGGVLTVSTREIELAGDHYLTVPGLAPGRYCSIRFQDTGTGIPEAIRGRVFDPFFTTKGFGAGSGLGLSTALGIVRGHGGQILVQSEPGRGATVQVFLPLLIRDEQDIARDAGVSGERPGLARTVLVVDDEQAVLRMTRKMLEREGYTVLTASDAVGALEVFHQNRHVVALAILDILMPGMDGIQLLQALRAVSPGLPVIMASGYSRETHNAALHGLDAAGYVQKPFDASALSRTVRNVLDATQ